MRYLRLLSALLTISATAIFAEAAEIPDSAFRYSAEVNASVSSGANTPFWLVNNRFGLSSIEKNNGYVRVGLFKDARKEGKRFSWGAGVDLAAPWNFTSSFVVQQLYADLRYRNAELSVGSKEWTGGFNNIRLSSGDLLFSNNSRPIPQARLSLPDYIVIPFTNRWVSLKGYIAYGAFTDDSWQRHAAKNGAKHTKHVLFHSKGGSILFGDTQRFPLTFEAGLQMGAQFGGQSISDGRVIDMPNGIKDWIKVFWPSAGGGDTPSSEQLNVYGNHTGEWDFRLKWAPKGSDWSAALYYEHFFEDHSMMFFDYTWRDMLLGLEVSLPSNPIVSALVYEYLYTKDQAGPVYWDHTPEIPEQVSGRDQYYNHGIYSGWQHWGMGIGNPLLRAPLYNSNHELYFYHNRVKAHHFGFGGAPLPGLDYRVLFTYNRSWGTYGIPTSQVLHGYNLLLEATWRPARLKGWSGTLSLGADWGKLTGRSRGMMLSISKSGWL